MLRAAARLPALDEMACNRCDRRGRVSTARLLAEHGPDMPVPALLRVIAADCRRMQAGRLHDVCGATCLNCRSLDMWVKNFRYRN